MPPTAERPERAAGLTPTGSAERFEILDVVRGFALLGVVVVNWYYAGVWDLLTVGQRQALWTAQFDRIVQILCILLFEDKFYTLFSMLFGLGFALQFERATRRGQNLIPTYARRLTILFVIGVGHALLFYYGDILHLYALLGFTLILFRNRSDRVILGWALSFLLLVLLQPTGAWFLTAHWPGTLAGGGPDVSHTERLAAVTTGGWGGVIWFNAHMLKADYGGIWEVAGNYFATLWRFLLGFWVGRRALLQHADRHVTLYRRLLPWALLIGLAGSGIHVASLFLPENAVYLPEAPFPMRLVWIPVELSIPALAVGYVCLLVLTYQRPFGRRVLGTLAPLGRMALTNYLMQSVVLVVLFYDVGFGLAGKVGIGTATLLALTTFLLQIAFSGWWLDRFRFGPAEWVWRCLSYGRWMPIRRGWVSVDQE